MSNSTAPWADRLFDLCVRTLYWLADVSGMSYKEVNVWLFCLWPVLTVVLELVVVVQWVALKKL